MKPHGPWQIVESRDIYRDPWLHLRKDDVVRPDGRPGTYSVVYLKPGVCVLPLDSDGTVTLTEEFHYGVGRVTLEAVSGGVEPNEQPSATARRELQEELGILAKDWTDLGPLDPFTGSVVSPTQLFLARELKFVDRSLEGTETIRPAKMSLEDALRFVQSGRITHAPSCVLILKAWLQLRLASP